MTAGDALLRFLAAEISEPVEGVDSLVHAVRSRLGDGVAAILFYGSCLRTGDYQDKVLDFYVLVDRYRKAYDQAWLAAANRILPPNVFYAEADGPSVRLRVKYAVLSVGHFGRLCAPRTFNSSVWVRFAQPTRLIYARDEAVEDRVVNALAMAATTSAQSVLGLIGEPVTSERLWCALFRESYRVEFRAEGARRVRDIYGEMEERYQKITPLVLERLGYEPMDGERFRPRHGRGPSAGRQRLAWFLRASQGKTLSVLRLMKASFTFDGGIDYLAWKIQRHSDVDITITRWQRRHPLIAGLVLFVRLRLKGAFR